MHFGSPSRFQASPSETSGKKCTAVCPQCAVHTAIPEVKIKYCIFSSLESTRCVVYDGATDSPSDCERIQSRRKNFIIWFVKQITIRYVHSKWANVSMPLLLLCKCPARCVCAVHTRQHRRRPDSAAASAFSHGFPAPDVMHKSMFVRLIIIHHTHVFKCLFGTAHHSDKAQNI